MNLYDLVSNAIMDYRKTIHRISLSESILSEYIKVGELLKKVLKKKYRDFYWKNTEVELTLFADLDKTSLEFTKMRCSENVYFNSTSTDIFGVKYNKENNHYEYSNLIEEIPCGIFDTTHENCFAELRKAINSVNIYIKGVMEEIITQKNDFAMEILNLEKQALISKNEVKEFLNNHFKSNPLDEKVIQKMEEIFEKKIYEIYADFSSVQYDKFEILIMAKTDKYTPDGSLSCFKVNHFNIGNLIINDKTKETKLEPIFKNSKLFKGRGTAIGYIRNNFKRQIFKGILNDTTI